MFNGFMAIVVALMWMLALILLAVMAGTPGFTPA